MGMTRTPTVEGGSDSAGLSAQNTDDGEVDHKLTLDVTENPMEAAPDGTMRTIAPGRH